MKTIKVVVSAALASSVMILAAVNVSAQENGNRDKDNKIVRGPYETNGFGGNWFIGIGGGINTFVDNGYDPRISPNIDVNVGKWFTPSVGARVGYQGFGFSEWAPNPTVLGPELNVDKGMYKRKQGFAYAHADVMWNISNAFSGYKETRFWDFVPYVHGGLLHGYGMDGKKFSKNEFAAGVGLYNTMRLSNRVKLALDLRGTVVNGRIHEAAGGITGLASATFGVIVNLGKTNWKRATQIPEGYRPYNIRKVERLTETASKLEKDNKALAQRNSAMACANDDLKKENCTLSKENGNLKKEISGLRNKTVSVTPGAVFFKIGQTVLDERELFNLDFYVKTCIRQDSGKVFKITGYADNQTGSKKRNQQLSEQRVQYVYDILKNKYNIPAERLVVKAAGAAARFSSPELNRSVVLE